MKHDEQALHAAAVNTVAALMAAAAKTAPKSCGADTLETVVLDGADKEDLADIMCELARETGMDFYRRDAENVRRSQCVVVIGAIASYMSTAHCGLCGMGNCGNAMRKYGGLCRCPTRFSTKPRKRAGTGSPPTCLKRMRGWRSKPSRLSKGEGACRGKRRSACARVRFFRKTLGGCPE
jgi:hypothetical protein